MENFEVLSPMDFSEQSATVSIAIYSTIPAIFSKFCHEVPSFFYRTSSC